MVVPNGQAPGDGQYSLDEALSELQRNDAPIIELQLLSGEYHLSSPITFSSVVRSSEVRVTGVGSVTISSSIASQRSSSSASQLRRLSESTPLPVMERKGMIAVEHGALHVNFTNLNLTTSQDASLLPLLSISNGKLTMQSCTFYGSRSSGLLITDGVVSIFDSAFHGNMAAPDVDGGAIRIHGGEVNIRHCRFSANAAQRGGAVFVSHTKSIWFRESMFRNNRAYVQGGAIFVTNGSVTLANQSLLEDNQASVAGSTLFVDAAALVRYALPAPPGYYIGLPTRCIDSADANQPACDSSVRNSTLWVLALPFEHGIPYRCAPGRIGSLVADQASQTSPLCSGPCEPGRYCEEGALAPGKLCTAGHYCPSASGPLPFPCSVGTYNPLEGQQDRAVCLGCEAGFYCGLGESVQQPCPTGTFSSELRAADSNACRDCPDNADTIGPNATHKDQCKCNVNYYKSDSANGTGWSCESCFAGVDCSMQGSALQSLKLRAGYWRTSTNATDVRRCNDANVGCTDRFCTYSQSGCMGGSDSARDCRASLDGVFCQLCKSWVSPEYARSLQAYGTNDTVLEYYVGATSTKAAHCEPCAASRLEFFVVPVVCLLTLVILDFSCARLLPRLWHSLRRTYTLPTKIKVLVGFYMIATRIEGVYELLLPTMVHNTLDVLRIIITIGLDAQSLTCVLTPGYIARLQFWIVAPLVPCLMVVVGTLLSGAVNRVLVRIRRGKQSNILASDSFWLRVLPHISRIVFLVYPVVTNVAFEAFSCVDFEEGRWLATDVDIVCDSFEHNHARNLAWIAVILYPAGLWVLNAVLLFCLRSTHLRQAIGFLHEDYAPQLYFWELFEMMRRFLLVGLFIVGPYVRGTMMQLALATLVTLAYLVLQTAAMPYRAFSDNFVALSCSTALTIVFLGSILYKYGTLANEPHVEEAMGDVQRSIYLLDDIVLTIILMACVVGTLALLAPVMLIHYVYESRRRQQEALSALVRRLRYRKDNNPVPAPLLESCTFHIFLSHVWGSGQDQMRIVKQRLLEMIPNLRVFLDVDDLKDGKGGEYVDISEVVLVFVSEGYFKSQNCMRELLRGMARAKPLITLVESEEKHGAMTREEVQQALQQADSKYAMRWGDAYLGAEVKTWLEERLTPKGQQLCEAIDRGEPVAPALESALFGGKDPIEWIRIGAFQDVTLRLIADSLLPAGHASTYVQDELICSKPTEPPVLQSSRFHVLCSRNNSGAKELMLELGSEHNFKVSVTENIDDLALCSHMLVYLTALTWTQGDSSAVFATDVRRAMDSNLHLLLAHEMTGTGGQEKRHGARFEIFFANEAGATPQELIQAGIYNSIAIPLKGGAWRETSMTMLMMALGGEPHEGMNALDDTDEDPSASFLSAAARKVWRRPRRFFSLRQAREKKQRAYSQHTKRRDVESSDDDDDAEVARINQIIRSNTRSNFEQRNARSLGIYFTAEEDARGTFDLHKRRWNPRLKQWEPLAWPSGLGDGTV